MRGGVWLLAASAAACGRMGFDTNVGEDERDSGTVVDADTALPTRVAVYSFDEGSGTTVLDRSGLTQALDLQLGADTSWVSGGIRFGAAATSTRSTIAAERIVRRCISSGENTIEVWVQPDLQMVAGAARIAGIAGNNNVSVASIGQEATTFYGQIRTSTSSAKLSSATGSTTLAITHLVHTHAADGTRTFSVDGVAVNTTTVGGDFSTWDVTLPLTFGDALDGGVRWQGVLLHAELHCRAFGGSEIQQRFAAGL